ncbi:MAG: peptidoglycan-binding protein [Actinobacteria bacterium]|nr:peptidoglycan-binding protein [Actinomycetota bacterium]
MTTSRMRSESTLSVDELADRLMRLGILPTQGTLGDAVLRDGIAAFQRSRGLDETGRVDAATKAALDEATYSFGDRPLYLTSPMLRGDDVAWLQLRLGSLGFNAGRVDGIFGAATQRALCEFQRNVDIIVDGVCARDTVAQLSRLSARMGDLSVVGLREREALLGRDTDLAGLTISVVAAEDDTGISGAIGAFLSTSAALVSVHNDLDWSILAAQTNEAGADVCLAVELVDEPILEIAYFGGEGFESQAGKSLAQALLRQLPHAPMWTEHAAVPKRLPILRETRCPTVRLRVGPLADIVEMQSMIVAAVARALSAWVEQPST